MPLYTFDPPEQDGTPKPPPPEETIVCYIDLSDSGETCKHCGQASGTGHGKKRG